MSNPREKYAVDREAEQAGAPVQIDDMTFMVRSASTANRKYRYALAKASEPRRAQLVTQDLEAFELFDSTVLIEAYADAVIVGWSGVDGEDGQPLEFNRDNCVALMQDCPKIWETVREAALDENRFKPAREDGDQLGKILVWQLTYGEHIERLEQAAAKGANVPALKSRPDVPLWLLPALDAWCDLGGGAPWWRVREWSAYYGINLEWLWAVLQHAARMVDEHNAKLRTQKRASTPGSRPDPDHKVDATRRGL